MMVDRLLKSTTPDGKLTVFIRWTKCLAQ